MKSAWILAGAAGAMLLASAAYADNTTAASSPSNLVVNGTFTGGTTGFSSDYIYADPSQPGYSETPETQYEITTNTSLVRSDGAWGSVSGPESGELFMVVNGATSLNADSTYRNFWDEIINLKPDTNYKISFDVANLYSASPATVALTVAGLAE
jgi:hypothetical protein